MGRPTPPAATSSLTRLWARDRVGDLELALATATAADAQQWARDEILALGLRHHLVTPSATSCAPRPSRSRRASPRANASTTASTAASCSSSATRHELGDAIPACLRAHIGRHLHALRPGRSAEIDLGAWMRF